MATKQKVPTAAEFKKLPKAEQQKWLKWEEDRLNKVPIVDPFPPIQKKKTTKKTK